MAKAAAMTPEQRLQKMMAGRRENVGYFQLLEAGWEPGVEGHIEVDGVNYERFAMPDGGFVVVEWDDGGNVNTI
jgi:hypothetical protein